MELIIANTFFLVLLFAVSFFLGLYVLMLSPADITHRLFFSATISLNLVFILMICLQICKNSDSIWLIYKSGTILMFILLYQILLFLIYITRTFRYLKFTWLFFISCIVSAVITLFSEQYIIFDKIENLLIVSDAIPTLAFWINPIYYSANVIMYGVILLSAIFNSQTIRERRQFIVLFLSLVTSLALVSTWLLIQMTIYKFFVPVPPLPLLMFLFILGCWYSIFRYKMFSITPALISSDILSNIDELIILLNRKSKIITANKESEILLKDSRLHGKHFNEIALSNNKIEKEINALIKNEINDFSTRLYFKDSEDNSIIAEARFSIIKDKFGDILGILIIAKELKEFSRLKLIYKITEREAEIIEYIIMGFTNMEIAEKLNISLNTMKRHINNIYSKLGVYNKMQLYALLREFNLIPETKAEKSLLFFN